MKGKIIISVSIYLLVVTGVIGLLLYNYKDNIFAESQFNEEDTEGTNEETNEDIERNSVSAAASATLKLNKKSATIYNTETLQLKITSGNESNKPVTWTSSNSGVATVDSKGKVKGVVAGKTTITATVGKNNVPSEIVVEKDQMHFIDIGFGGNSILLESNNKFVLIDAGDIDTDKHADANLLVLVKKK